MSYIPWFKRMEPITLGERFELDQFSTRAKPLSPTKSYAEKPTYNWEEGDWWDLDDQSVGNTKILEDFEITEEMRRRPNAEGGRIGLRYAGPVKLIEIFEKIMQKPNYSLDDAVVAVNKLKLNYSPDKVKSYFKNFVSDKRSMSTEEYLTYIKERIKDPSIPHKANWNKPLMGSPLEVKGFGKRKNVPVSNLMAAEKQLSAEELKLWRAYTQKQQSKAKFARKVSGERIDPVTGDVIKDPTVRSDWLSKAYVRKGIRRAKKSDAYKKLSPLERLKLEFFEKRLDVMGNIIKDNPALLKNKEVIKFLETGVNAKTGKIIKSPVDFSQIKDRRFWELEHIDPIKGGQTKMRGSFLSNVQVLPKSIHKNFKEPAEKFLNENWGKKEYANEINEILKHARKLKVTLRVNDVGPVGYKATFENFLDKADDVFNFYVRDSGAKKLYSEKIAEMKPANIKFNWKNLGFKEAPSEEIIQKAVTETTRPAFKGIKDAVLLSTPAVVAAETATAEELEPSDKKQEASVIGDVVSAVTENPLKSAAAVVSGDVALNKAKLSKAILKGGEKVLAPFVTPGATTAIHLLEGEFDVTNPANYLAPMFWKQLVERYGAKRAAMELLKVPGFKNKASVMKDVLIRSGLPVGMVDALSRVSFPLAAATGVGYVAKESKPNIFRDDKGDLRMKDDQITTLPSNMIKDYHWRFASDDFFEKEYGIKKEDYKSNLPEFLDLEKQKAKKPAPFDSYFMGGIASLIK